MIEPLKITLESPDVVTTRTMRCLMLMNQSVKQNLEVWLLKMQLAKSVDELFEETFTRK